MCCVLGTYSSGEIMKTHRCVTTVDVIPGSLLRSLIVSFFLCLMKKKTFVVVMIQRGSLNKCFFFCMSWCESFKSLEESHEK